MGRGALQPKRYGRVTRAAALFVMLIAVRTSLNRPTEQVVGGVFVGLRDGGPASPRDRSPRLCRCTTARDAASGSRDLCVVFDVMGTLVRESFMEVVPSFFEMPQKELFQVKNASAWFAFERGELSEQQAASTYFNDRRSIDYAGLKLAFQDSYEFLDGVPGLLRDLDAEGYAMHAFSNYPVWYKMIEDKLGLESEYGVRWTAVSCKMGVRKPDPRSYDHLLALLSEASGKEVRPGDVVFIDDREENCLAARDSGIHAVHFHNVAGLRAELCRDFGISLGN